MKNRCPNCGRLLTIGVLHRVGALADKDRPEGFVPKNAIPFKSMIPLHEILAGALRSTLSSQKVWQIYNKLTAAFGNEFAILLNAPREQLIKIVPDRLADIILENRAGHIKVKPGYDGVYGIPIFDEAAAKEETRQQRSLKQFAQSE